MNDKDREHLVRCVELAEEALETGNDPFGSVLVSADGHVLFEDRNRTVGGDETRHPEFEIVRWAVTHLTPEERADSTVYTSGEHCVMCAAADAWVGLGRIVYVASAGQIAEWRGAKGAAPSPVRPLPITAVAPGLHVDGPADALVAEVRVLIEHHLDR